MILLERLHLANSQFTLVHQKIDVRQIVGQATNELLKFSFISEPRSHPPHTKKNNKLTLRRDQHINEKKRKEEKNDVADTTTVELLSQRIGSKKEYSHTNRSMYTIPIANGNYTKNQFLSIFDCRVF